MKAENQKAPLFSIIVPVYNVRDYIEKSIDSVLNQSFTDFELLLIDDGSTDGSGECIDRVASQDARVRTFHQANSGVSAARNLGLDKALGQWIVFVDGDDALVPNALQILSECISCRLRSINVDDFDPEELATKPVKLPEKVRKVEAA